jgi:hypothetical protein
MRVNIFAVISLLLSPHARASPTNFKPPNLIVSSFGAFVSSDWDLKTHVSFNVVDPRTEYYYNATCKLSATMDETRQALGRYTPCGSANEVFFFLARDLSQLSLKRPWVSKDGDQ